MSVNPYTSAPLSFGHINVLYTERGMEEDFMRYMYPQHPMEKQNIIIEGEKGIGKTTLLMKIQYQLKQDGKKLPLMYTLTQMTNYRIFLIDVLTNSLEYTQDKRGGLSDEEAQLLALLQNEVKLKYTSTGVLETQFLKHTTEDTVIFIDNANYMLTNIIEMKNLFVAHGFNLKPVFILCFVDTDLTLFMEQDAMGFFDRFGTTLKVKKMTFDQVEDMILKRLKWASPETEENLDKFLSHDQLKYIYTYFEGFPRGIISVCRNLYDIFTLHKNVTDIDVGKEMIKYQNKLSTRHVLSLNPFKKDIVMIIYGADGEVTYKSIFTQINPSEGEVLNDESKKRKRSKANLSIALSELVTEGIVTKIDRGIYTLSDEIYHLLNEVGSIDKIDEYWADNKTGEELVVL